MDEPYRLIPCDDLEALPAALRGLDEDLIERVFPLQERSGKQFSHVRIEIWEDSGRVIAYPCKDVQNRIDVAGTQVQCMEAIRYIEGLDRFVGNDERHEEARCQLVQKMAKIVMDSLSEKTSYEWRLYDQDGLQYN